MPMRARITNKLIASMREMRARNRTYECIGRLHGCSESAAYQYTRDVPVNDIRKAQAQQEALAGMRHRAVYYQGLVARIARVMPEAVR